LPDPFSGKSARIVRRTTDSKNLIGWLSRSQMLLFARRWRRRYSRSSRLMNSIKSDTQVDVLPGLFNRRDLEPRAQRAGAANRQRTG
jgi:hypothetical protein